VASKKENLLLCHLQGRVMPEFQGKDIPTPTYGEIVSFIESLDGDEMRNYLSNPAYGKNFKLAVDAAYAEYYAAKAEK
jgi:hypothetical protein